LSLSNIILYPKSGLDQDHSNGENLCRFSRSWCCWSVWLPTLASNFDTEWKFK